MNNKKFFLIALLLLASSAIAGDNKRGEAGFMFLKIPMGARETAMGLSGLTSTTGASAIYWNPANVAYADRPTFSFSYLNYFAGISSNYAAVSYPMGDLGVIGASLNYVSYGEIDVTTVEEPEGTGATYSPYEMALGFSFSKQVTDRVSGGVTLKYISSHISTVSASNIGFDFGFAYTTGIRGLKMGFAITNIGGQSAYSGTGLVRDVVVNEDATVDGTASLRFNSEPFEMPASVNFGASMDLYRNEQNAVTGMLEQNVNSFQANRTNFGLEYGFQNMFFARGGYTTAFSRDKDFRTGKAKWAGVTWGLGVDYKFNDNLNMAIDYGYMNLGLLDATHRFTVGIKF